jgi:CRP-like cAMP-binding protein
MLTPENNQLLKVLSTAVHPLDEEEWGAFADVWVPFKASRKEVLTTADDIEKYLYVVTKGMQRIFYLDDENREATLVFTYAPSFGGVIDSLFLQQPSRYFYETLTPSEFLRASYSDVAVLMEKYRGVEALIRKGVTIATSGVLERLVELQCFTAEQRFRNLLKRSPHILQLIPHKYLANYLGMDPTNFSKLMNKIKI